MSISLSDAKWFSPPDDPVYPSSDGKPMSDSDKQFNGIVDLKQGIDAILRDVPNVYVSGNTLWYPVEGDPKIRMSPDVYVVFGRPRGYRGSYIQFREDNVPVHVAFEVLSPGNRAGEMRRKLAFYETYGVEEYYILDPEKSRHKGYLRDPAGKLQPIVPIRDWVSPRLNIRFTFIEESLKLIGPGGLPLQTYANLQQQRDRYEQQAEQARDEAEQARDEADRERLKADQAQQAADQAQQAVERERLRAERLRAQLRALGMEPED